MAPGPGAAEPGPRLAIRLIIAVVAAGALAPAVRAAGHAADSGFFVAIRDNRVRPEHRIIAAMEFLGTEMDRLVPKGSRVYLHEPNETWRFRLQEVAVMHALVVTPDEAGADLVLRLRPDPGSPAGVALEVTAAAR
ncbi:hypothetical protein [Dactylosporangium sp. NPDC051541]|uniref:hypothetical protein n=1 Tax=Dactylosporangium sp. NPDC051541 TaxID=3363977 RepID=UPI0037B6537B